MRLHVHGDEQIARLPAVRPDVTHARDPDAREVGQPGRHLNRQRLAADLELLTAAGRAHDLLLASRPAAVRARLREHHVSPRRLHGARPMAVRAAALVGVQPARALARVAALLPRDGDLALPAAHRFLEAERDRLMQIRTALRFAVRPTRLALLQHIGKQIAEGGRRRPAHPDREIEPLEAERRLFDRRAALRAGVVPAAPLRIDQRLVRVRDLAELRRRHPIPRIDVRVMAARQPLVRPLDVARRGVAVEAEDNIEIHEIADCRLESSDLIADLKLVNQSAI